ncbi:MAG: sulfatase-like hydrolase/transferase [Candidatus Hodarchaeota archaeon]
MNNPSNKLPHIIIFNPDSWRGDVMGHLGTQGAVTPNLDRMVEEDGISLKYSFCQNPVCTPSRCSYFTGWYPHVRGHRTMHHMLHPERGEPNLLAILKEAGYFVWWSGKNDLVPGQDAAKPDLGLDLYCDVKFEPTREDWIRWNRSSMSFEDPWRGEPGSDTYYSFMEGKRKTPAEMIAEFDDGDDDDDDDIPGYGDRDWGCVLGACDFIREYKGDKPLCIVITIGYPHPAYRVEEPYFSMIDRSAIEPPVPKPGTTNDDWVNAKKPSLLMEITNRQNLRSWTEDRWIELKAVYFGMCARVDDQFGLVMKALKDRQIYDDSLVFMFSDHGDFTGDFGLVEKTQNTFEESMVRVPFVIKPPSWTPCNPGIREALVELVDFPATVYDIAGIKPNYWHFGKSLKHLFKRDEQHRDAVFCEGGRLKGEYQAMERESTSAGSTSGLYWPRISLQTTEWKDPSTPMYHTKATMCRTGRYKYVMRLYESDELYDLENDPGETTNLIDDEGCLGILHEMERRLLRHYMETCDVVPMETDSRGLIMEKKKD